MRERQAPYDGSKRTALGDVQCSRQQFIQRRVPDPHTAEDILQDASLKIHTRIATFQQQDRVAAWIYQIARNAIADYYRTRRPTTDVPETLIAPDAMAEEDVVRELLPCVAAMVDALPEPYREALRLTEYEGLSQKGLSEQLGISFSGAKSRVQRTSPKSSSSSWIAAISSSITPAGLLTTSHTAHAAPAALASRGANPTS